MATFSVGSVEKKRVKRNPPAPFQTSTLQQEASRKLGFGAQATMRTAQSLYEGVEIGGETVKIGRIAYDQSNFSQRYEPGHPAADASGYVRYPNVNSLVESMDMRQAQRSYEANLNVVMVTRQMLGATLDVLKG